MILPIKHSHINTYFCKGPFVYFVNNFNDGENKELYERLRQVDSIYPE